MDRNNHPLEQNHDESTSTDVEEAPADSSEDPAAPEDFEEEGMGIAPKE